MTDPMAVNAKTRPAGELLAVWPLQLAAKGLIVVAVVGIFKCGRPRITRASKKARPGF